MPMDKTEEDYRAESDLRTLVEAKKIMADKKRHGRAMKLGRAERKHLSAVTKGCGPCHPEKR